MLVSTYGLIPLKTHKHKHARTRKTQRPEGKLSPYLFFLPDVPFGFVFAFILPVCQQVHAGTSRQGGVHAGVGHGAWTVTGHPCNTVKLLQQYWHVQLLNQRVVEVSKLVLKYDVSSLVLFFEVKKATATL